MNFKSNKNNDVKIPSDGSPQKYRIKSARKHKKNSVSPATFNDNSDNEEKEQRPRTFSEYLFTTQSGKATKSYYINVKKNRKIHVRHFAQNENDLHIGNGERNENFNTAIVLFFIHGVGGSADMWDPQTKYFLYEGYEVITFDMLGHGYSSKPSDYKEYQFQELAQDVLTVFDQFCKRRNVIIGHSYGSSFCTLLAKERGNFISKVVLISGGGPTTLMPERCSAFCLPYPLFYLIAPGVVKAFRKMAFHVNTSENVKNKLATFRLSPFTLKAVMQGQHWLESDEEFHSDLLVPVLLLHGSGDQFVSLDEEIWMNETIYGSHLEVIENAGHMVTIEAPQEVNAAIHTFLNRDKSTASMRDNSQLGLIPDEQSTCSNETPRHSIDTRRCDSSQSRCSFVCPERSLSRNSTRSVRTDRRKTMY